MEETLGLKTLIIGAIPVLMNCSSISVTLSLIFQGKGVEKDLIEIEKQQSEQETEQVNSGINIASWKNPNLECDT